MGTSRTQRLWLLLILAVAVGVYSNSLGNSFHYDDVHSIVENVHVRSLQNIPAFFYDSRMFSEWGDRSMFRPLVLVSYALNHAVGGYDVLGYHLVNLSLHLLAVIAVFAIARTTGSRYGPIIGAAIFAVHPVNGEAVNYISSRSESMSALCYLISIYAYLRWRHGGSKSGSGAYALALLAFAAGLSSKSIVITLPVLLLLLERSGFPGSGTVLDRSALLRSHSPFWLVSAGYLAIVRQSAGKAVLSEPVRGWADQISTQLKALVYYAHLLEMPVRLNVEHQFFGLRSGSGMAVILAGLLVLSLTWMVWNARTAKAWLAIVAAGLCLLPSLVVPLHVLVNEHRLYLALALMCAFGVAGWAPARSRTSSSRAVVYAVMGAVAALAMLSHQRNSVWIDERTLWRDAVAKAPEMYRAHMHLGGAYEAEAEIHKRERRADYYRSLSLALSSHKRAVELAPNVAEAHYNHGNALRTIGRTDEAVQAYARSLSVSPDFVPALLNWSSPRSVDGVTLSAHTAELRLDEGPLTSLSGDN